MILLAIGLVAFLAALRAFPEREGRLAPVRGTAAFAWFAVVAGCTLLQLRLGADELDRYRFTLLGFRQQVAGVGGAPLDRVLEVGGSEEHADLWVPGAGDEPAVELRPVGPERLTSVLAEPGERPAAVGLVERPGLLGSSWTVLGARRFGEGDTLVVRGAGGTLRLTLSTAPAELPFLDARVPLPWVRQPVLSVAGEGPPASSVTLPALETSLVRRLRGDRPSVFQRTYPLSDVVDAVREGEAAGAPALASFLFWQDGRLHVALLDEEVGLESPDAATPADVPVWTAEEGGRRLLVAGLPHRDYPEPDLILPERYGLRPLRTFELGVTDGELDARLGAPEIHALDRETLAAIRLPGTTDDRGRPVYRVRLASGADALARQAVVFDRAPASYGAAAQAVLRLPEEPTTGRFDLLTPSGLATWETGRPFTLGTGDRSLLVRVDGQGTSAGFWLVHLLVMAAAGAVFLLRPMNGPVFAVALAATGLACVRLVLGVSALALPPFVQEGQQIGLWLLPLLPWAVALAAESARPLAGSRAPDVRGGLFHGTYAFFLGVLGLVLFPGSAARAVVTVGVPLGLVLVWAWSRRRRSAATEAGPGAGLERRLGRLADRHPRLAHGWTLGAGLLALRVVLEAAGWREQLTVGGTRIGVSVVFTPLLVVTLAVLLWRLDRRFTEARDPRPAASRALLEIGGFLALGYVAVSGWVSDFGVALVLAPGALLVVAALGARWARRVADRRTAAFVRVALATPALLFLLVQATPPLLSFAWRGDVDAAEARMGEWNRNELLLLERGDPDALRMIGQRRSEALAVMRETMRSYTRGNWGGRGFLEGRVTDEIAETAVREHVPSALLASQFGFPGTAALVLLLLAFLPPVLRSWRSGPDRSDSAGRRRDPGLAAAVGVLAVLVLLGHGVPSPLNAVAVGLLVLGGLGVLLAPAFGFGLDVWGGGEGGEELPAPAALPASRVLAAAAGATLAGAGLYMVLANYGLTFFTGKNVYLLGLDSVGDALEGLALLLLVALPLGLETVPRTRGRGAGPAAGDAGPASSSAERDEAEWAWSPEDGWRSEGRAVGAGGDAGRLTDGGGRR